MDGDFKDEDDRAEHAAQLGQEGLCGTEPKEIAKIADEHNLSVMSDEVVRLPHPLPLWHFTNLLVVRESHL